MLVAELESVSQEKVCPCAELPLACCSNIGSSSWRSDVTCSSWHTFMHNGTGIVLDRLSDGFVNLCASKGLSHRDEICLGLRGGVKGISRRRMKGRRGVKGSEERKETIQLGAQLK